jgi:HEAT repeat protein
MWDQRNQKKDQTKGAEGNPSPLPLDFERVQLVRRGDRTVVIEFLDRRFAPLATSLESLQFTGSRHLPAEEIREALKQFHPHEVQVLAEPIRLTANFKANFPPIFKLEDEGPTAILAKKAAQSLWAFGDASIPILVEALDHPIEHIRKIAIQSLGEIGPAASPAVPKLVALLENDKSGASVYEMIATCLGQIGPIAAETSLPALIHASRDAKRSNKEIARAIVRILPKEESSIPTLIEQFSGCWDGEVWVNAIKRIGPCAVPYLLAALNDERADIRRGAISTLAELRCRTPEVMAALRKALDDVETQMEAVPALLSKREENLPTLIKILKSSESTYWEAAISRIGSIEPAPIEAIPILIDHLRHPVSVNDSFQRACGAIVTLVSKAGPKQHELALSGAQALIESVLLCFGLREIDARIALRDLAGKSKIIPSRVAEILVNLETSQLDKAMALGELGAEALVALPALRRIIDHPKNHSPIPIVFAQMAADKIAKSQRHT